MPPYLLASPTISIEDWLFNESTMKPKPKTSAELTREYRERKKAQGFVPLTVLVLKKSVAKIKAIEAADKASKKGE